jgi:FGGY family of carbohydrate kinases, N-terminal domain
MRPRLTISRPTPPTRMGRLPTSCRSAWPCGLLLVDRNGTPVRNAILSPDLRASAMLARWRAEGAEARSLALTLNSQFPGKPMPLIAWLEAHEPEALDRAHRALFCKDYLRFRLIGEIGLEISDMSSAGLVGPRLRRWAPDTLEPFGLSRYTRLFGDGVEPLTIVRRGHQKGRRGNGPRRRNASLGRLCRWPGDGARARRDRRKPHQRDRWHVGPEPAHHRRPDDGREFRFRHRRPKARRMGRNRRGPDFGQRIRMVRRFDHSPRQPRPWRPRRPVRLL